MDDFNARILASRKKSAGSRSSSKKKKKKPNKKSDVDKAIESEILAVESDEEEVPPLPPPLIHPALNTYHSNSVAATTVGRSITTTTVAIRNPTVTSAATIISSISRSTTTVTAATHSSATVVAQRNATVTAAARSSDMVTSTTTITTMARGRLGAITTTTGHTTTTRCPATVTVESSHVGHIREGAGFPTQQQYYDNFYYGNKIILRHNTYVIHAGSGSMANRNFCPYPGYPPPQQEAPDLLALYHSLDGRVKQLEDAIASGMAASGSSERSGMPSVLELSREQELTVHMILSSNAGWTVAMRKILVIVFGVDTLAGSCAVGRKNSTTAALSTLKLNAIKGVYNSNEVIIFFIITDLILTNYVNEKIKEGEMNIIINSACAGARRTLKK